MRHLAEAYEVYTVAEVTLTAAIDIVNIHDVYDSSQLGKSRVNAKLKRYHLTFSGAGTAHNLYCNV